MWFGCYGLFSRIWFNSVIHLLLACDLCLGMVLAVVYCGCVYCCGWVGLSVVLVMVCGLRVYLF